MKPIIFITIVLGLFSFFMLDAKATIESVATTKGSFLLQDGGIDGGYTKKVVYTWAGGTNSSGINIDIQDINGNSLFSQFIQNGLGNYRDFGYRNIVNMNNGSYLVGYQEKSSNGQSGFMVIDTVNQVITEWGSVGPIKEVFLKADSSGDIMIAFRGEYSATNNSYGYYSPQSSEYGICAGSCTLANGNTADFVNHGDGIDYDYNNERHYELNYINGALFYTDILGQMGVLQVSSTTGNSIGFEDITTQSGFVSSHTQFLVDSIDISNGTIKIVNSLIDEDSYLMEYNLNDQSLTLLTQITDEFIVGYFDGEFKSIPKGSSILTGAETTKEEAFIGFIEINGEMLITSYNTASSSWVVDNTFIPVTYLANDLFAGSLSGGSGGTDNTGTGSTSYDSDIWNFDQDGDGEVGLLNGEIFTGIGNVISYFFDKIIDFFASVRDLVTRILDVFTTEEKTFTFFATAHAIEPSIIGSVMNDNYTNNEEAYNETMLGKYVKFTYAFIYSLILIVAIAIYIKITHPQNDA